MVRCGLSADSVQVGIYNVFGKTYADAFFKTGGSYACTYFRAIASGARGNVSRTWVLVNSSEVSGTSASDAKTSTECYATIAAAATALHNQAYSSTVSGSDSGTTSYANSAGTASVVRDSNDGGSTTFAYSKAGLAYGDYSWLAGWNGKELRAVSKSQFATASHTHNYAGSGSAGGSANSAVKLDSSAGNANTPVYFSGGKPVALGYTIAASVPANAKFTDTNTTYDVFKAASASAAGGKGLVPAPAAGKQGLYLRGDGQWATPTNTVYSHPNSGVTAGTYRSVTVNAQGHVTAGTNPTTLAGYGITDAAKAGHKHVIADITDNIPASKISGVLSLSNIPAGALERLIPVVDDDARFKLTKNDAQNGDVVKVKSTGQMYFIKDDTKLSTEDGYEVFVAGTAAAVAWGNVTGKPSTFTPSAHTQAISTITGLQTALDGKASTATFGKATADAAGSNGLVPAPAAGNQGLYLRGDGTWAKPTDTQYGVFKAASASAAGGTGLVPAPAAGKQSQYLRGDGQWATPTNTTYNVFKGSTTSADGGTGLVPQPKIANTSQFLRGDGTWATPTDTKYSHPTYTARAAGFYKVTVDGTGHVSAVANVTKGDITALGIPGQDTKYNVFKAATADAAGGTGLVPQPAAGANGKFLRGDGTWAKPTDTQYGNATQQAAGLMSAADKTHLDACEEWIISTTTPTKNCMWLKTA